VPAVDRAARLLEVLARENRDWGAAELAEELEIAANSARAILFTLQRHELVERDIENGKYRLGLGAARLGRAAGGRMDLRTAARPSLERLLAETGETVLLGVRNGQSIVIVDALEPDDDLHMSATIGDRVPITAGALGKVLLSEPGAFEEVLEGGGELRQFTQRTQTDVDAYAAELGIVRSRGFALDDEELVQGVRAASAPVKGPDGGTVGAITVVGFRTRISRERLEDLGQAVRQEALATAARLAGRA
jgi:DNA-binding IclR family transcriptional regulator